ncbi:MAG: hypothetical protein RL582_44 [Bacteroidota bacterium]|jgi:hypothetical protein
MEEIIKNKVAESGIITVNLEDFFPAEEVVLFDIKDYLFMGMILKEKDFRQAIKDLDLTLYQKKLVGVTCSVDAIVPVWAYMLIASALSSVSFDVVMGANEIEIRKKIQLRNIRKIETQHFTDKRVVIKGCGEEAVSEEAYLEITNVLKPVVKSLMYGEPCSTVPVFKKSS